MSTIIIQEKYRIKTGQTSVSVTKTLGDKATLKIYRDAVDITANCTVVISGGVAAITLPIAQLGVSGGYTATISYTITENLLGPANSTLIVGEQTGVGASDSVKLNGYISTVHSVLTGTGTISSTVVIEVSNNGTDWVTAGTITLSNTSTLSDGFAINAKWGFVRARVSAISGTNAKATTYVNV